mmetsp:Transcript_59170/g.157481  ORF Transcript_59170/g.157481 Transcript_59170/m.157481 type:complete len:204 (-) Transcript_59170:179-790(-)
MATMRRNKGPIALLQEFVQSACSAPLPQSRAVLQWTYETCSIERADAFRAIVAFYLDSIPHHVLGEWQRSKKLAQRDVADRALGLYVDRWRKDVSRETHMEHDPSRPVPLLEHRLRDEFGSLAVPEWSVEWTGEQARATARIHLYGVEHSFQGALKEDKVAAITDTARRVLWYLQTPGYGAAFVIDEDVVMTKSITEPPSTWR